MHHKYATVYSSLFLHTHRAKHVSESVGEDVGTGRRLSKHLERKEKLHSSSGAVPGGGIEPPSLGVAGVAGSVESKKRARKEAAIYKRRKEDEYSESTRLLERKRKRDQVDDELSTLETKKLRTSSEVHEYHSSSKELERSSSRSRGEMVEMDPRGSGERKRRHDSIGLKDESLSRKYQRMCSPDVPPAVAGSSGTNRRQNISHSSRVATSPSNKRNDSQHSYRKERKLGSTGGNESTTEDTLLVNDGDGESSKNSHKKLDWLLVNSYTRKATARLEQRPKSALKQYSPGAIFTEIGVSPSLAGSEYYSKICLVVSAHLKEQQQEENTMAYSTEPSSVTPLSESVINDPFGDAEFASVGVSRISEQLEWSQLVRNSIGVCRRALTASADYSLRKKLRKTTNQRVSVDTVECVVHVYMCIHLHTHCSFSLPPNL